MPFFGRPHLQVLVYWLRELTTDTASGHAVHVSMNLVMVEGCIMYVDGACVFSVYLL